MFLAGWALDRRFRGNWAAVGACMALGVIAGYAAVIHFGGSPVAIAVWFGLVGSTLGDGPDTLLCGAASVQVAGVKNAVAVAGLVNGMGSIGSVVQEQVIGWLVHGIPVTEGVRDTNLLALAMSIVMALLLALIAWRLHVIDSKSEMRPVGDRPVFWKACVSWLAETASCHGLGVVGDIDVRVSQQVRGKHHLLPWGAH